MIALADRPAVAIVGVSSGLAEALDQAECLAATSLPILLMGETGVGKELFAEHIHARTGRRGPMTDVNCAAIPPELADSILFGHTRGAFTGAIAATDGVIRRAAGGTLFLDELASLSVGLQAKLLRVLETREVQRVGAGDKQRVDFRLIAAAQPDLELRLEDGRFRPDLYHRVAAGLIWIPPLRERPDDIPVLADHFAARLGGAVNGDAQAVLAVQRWRGNVRELRGVVERAVALGGGTATRARVEEALGFCRAAVRNPGRAAARAELVATCRAHGWAGEAIAAAMGVSRATLFRRLQAAGVRLRTPE